MISSIPTHFSHYNQLWASLLIEELVRLGVGHVCIAPGSRSTPLTLAAVTHAGLTCHSHFDERGLGFLALGISKVCHQPVAVIVTSGSAVANLYPAVVEAYQTQQPLILLTADRPDELIDCGANQAIEQPGIFTHFTTAQLNLPPPGASLDWPDLLRQVDWAVQSQPQGPVHINCPFREPLYPTPTQQQTHPELLASLGDWLESSSPLHALKLNTTSQSLTLPPLPGVIIAGALEGKEQQAALALQRQLGWPLLADVQSNLRGQPTVIHYPELALQIPEIAQQLAKAQQFLLLGGRLISQSLQDWLAQTAWQFSCQISAHPGPFDAGLVIMKRLYGSVADVDLARDMKIPKLSIDSHRVNERIKKLLQQAPTKGLSECGLARKLENLLPEASYLMLGNSLPVRLFEQGFAGSQTILTNRGASGIDGLLATAAGLSCGQTQHPVILVLGDLSLLHDLNSLALTKLAKVPLLVILLNNDGGNIFDLLPVPDAQTLDQYYRLRHGYQFASIAQQLGWQNHQPKNWDELTQVVQAALQHKGGHFIELLTPPGEAAIQLKQAQRDAQQLTL